MVPVVLNAKTQSCTSVANCVKGAEASSMFQRQSSGADFHTVRPQNGKGTGNI